MNYRVLVSLSLSSEGFSNSLSGTFECFSTGIKDSELEVGVPGPEVFKKLMGDISRLFQGKKEEVA